MIRRPMFYGASIVAAMLWLPASLSAQPATQPAIPVPSQFSDMEHLWIDFDLPLRADGLCNGTISLGADKSERRFPLRAKLNGTAASGEFTDDDGRTFAFTARLDDTTLFFQTGRTEYRLERTTGNPGILRMMLQQVSDGYAIRDLIRNGAAERAGMRAGDVITAVDGRSTAGVDVGELGLRGFVGTSVTLAVRRVDGSRGDFHVRREYFDRSRYSPPPGQPGGGRSRGIR
jgi:hypothetical protein